MDEARLPLDATLGQLVQRISEVQERVRVRKADAVELASMVIDQLDRARSCANLLELPLDWLQPRGQFWLPLDVTPLNDVTLVEVRSFWGLETPMCTLHVRRGMPSSGAPNNGQLTFTLLRKGATRG